MTALTKKEINAYRKQRYPLPEGMERNHENCREVYGVCRPGKTEQDKLRGHVPYQKNRRVY